MRQWNGATSHGADTGPRAELGRELERSRRYERSFALVRVHVHGLNGSTDRTYDELRSCLRSIDRVWAAGGDLVYLLPECNRAQATGFVKRLANATGVELATTIACFPEDGLTGGLLVELVCGDPDALSEVTEGNGNGPDRVNGHRRRGLLDLLRRRKRPEAAIEWTDISPTPTPSVEPLDGRKLREAEKATR